VELHTVPPIRLQGASREEFIFTFTFTFTLPLQLPQLIS